MVLGPSGTLVGYRKNPRRRRRSHRRASRRVHRRYRRSSYRKNPGGMLIDLAKKAVPVLLAFYGSRMVVSKIGPMIPGVTMLGTFQGPALAVGAVLLANYATKKVSFLAKHRDQILMGATFSALDTLIRAFAPASVQSMIGMGDYVAVGDYLAIGATPIDDNIAFSDYIAIGGDGVEQDLGLEEELGVEEELGNDLLGGVSQNSLLRTVPTRRFLAPVPTRSFTEQVPQAGSQYDNPDALYAGIFRGAF